MQKPKRNTINDCRHSEKKHTLDSARLGNFSKDSRFSSPDFPYFWPAYILPAVTVDTPMPSPRNRITFFATLVLRLMFSASCKVAWASAFQSISGGVNMWFSLKKNKGGPSEFILLCLLKSENFIFLAEILFNFYTIRYSFLHLRPTCHEVAFNKSLNALIKYILLHKITKIQKKLNWFVFGYLRPRKMFHKKVISAIIFYCVVYSTSFIKDCHCTFFSLACTFATQMLEC